MESFINARKIQQGEDWSLDITLSQSSKEYIPFIIGKRENPHFVVTVASTKFEKNNRYVESWWLPVNVPMFEQTVPQYLGILATAPTSLAAINEDFGWSDEPFDRLYQYRLTADGDDGPYYYVYFDEDYVAHYDYKCRLTFNLSTYADNSRQIGTSNWSSQQYMYQITLVSGEEMVDTIMAAKRAYPELDWRTDWPVQGDDESDADYRIRMIQYLNTTQEDIFNFIKKRKPDYFQPDIDWDSPLGQIWVPQPILPPTELTVNNNLRTII